MRRFVVPALPDGGEVVLDALASHHLLRVLRAAPGEPVELVDGRGGRARARFDAVRDALAVVVLDGDVVREATPDVVLALALLKGPAMDLAVRMATEAGATRIQPVLTARSVATGDRADRWERIAVAAAQQCGRADLPVVSAPIPFSAAVGGPFAGVDRRIALPGGVRGEPARGPVAVLVGPEGGFAPGEARQATDAGWVPIGLGPHVLRAETAAAVAVALVHPT